MIKKTVGFLLLTGIILGGCSTDDEFGESSEKTILEFQLEKQLGTTRFKDDSIFVKVPDEVYVLNLTDLSASSIKVSDYATVSPKVGEKQDFTNPVPYTVQAEDGSKRVYYVVVLRADGSELQLSNSSFDFWYEATYGDTKYIEIGENAEDKMWATGNQGAAFAIALGAAADLPSLPYETAPGKNAAELTTQNMGALAAAFGGKGIAAGSVFVGEFVIGNVTNAHPLMGIPYTLMPKGFQVDYTYNPGEGLVNGILELVEGSDALDMYVILEKRDGNQVKRLGVGWFRSSDAQTDWKTIEVDIKYARGAAPEGVKDYEKHVLKYGVDGNPEITDPALMPEVTWGDIANETPTHILVTLTSSYQGDYFIGAPGSKLLVDDFKLIY